MAFSTPGIEEARLDAIEALLVANLSSLNASLQTGALWPSTVPITAAMVTIGQPRTWPGQNIPLLICVVAGGRSDELDIESERMYIELTSTSGFTNTLYTNIYTFLHPDSIVDANPLTHARKCEKVRARLSDWVRAKIFNGVDNQTIALSSQEYHTGGEYDYLDRVRAKAGYKGLFDEGFGGSLVCYASHTVIEAIVA